MCDRQILNNYLLNNNGLNAGLNFDSNIFIFFISASLSDASVKICYAIIWHIWEIYDLSLHAFRCFASSVLT